MRCEKTDTSYSAIISFACGLMLVKSVHTAQEVWIVANSGMRTLRDKSDIRYEHCCLIDLSEYGRSEVWTAGDALPVVIEMDSLARVTLPWFLHIFRLLKRLDGVSKNISHKMPADPAGSIRLP